jgi:transposase InsO family protein
VEIRRLIREMSLANRLWGAPRIHGELLKLGIEVAQSTVAKYMARSGRGRSQTWKTFLRNHAAGIGAMDFLIVPTAGFRLLFVLVILRHQRRRLISLSVTPNPTAEWIARQITEAFPWDEAPDYLIRDRDASYGGAVTRRLTAMGIRDHPTAPRSPWQNGHAERLIGSIRRECLDHIVVFGEAHLRRILAAYVLYTTISERICLSIKIRRAIGQSDGSASLPHSRSLVDFIINIAGCSSQQALQTGKALHGAGGTSRKLRRGFANESWPLAPRALPTARVSTRAPRRPPISHSIVGGTLFTLRTGLLVGGEHKEVSLQCAKAHVQGA